MYFSFGFTKQHCSTTSGTRSLLNCTWDTDHIVVVKPFTHPQVIFGHEESLPSVSWTSEVASQTSSLPCDLVFSFGRNTVFSSFNFLVWPVWKMMLSATFHHKPLLCSPWGSQETLSSKYCSKYHWFRLGSMWFQSFYRMWSMTGHH